MSLFKKFILGTANFGMDYGIAFGEKVSEEEVRLILELAEKFDIFGVDTASAYGDAEVVLGKYLRKNSKLKVISKLRKGEYKSIDDVMREIEKSLQALKVFRIEYYLVHSFENFLQNPEILSKALIKATKEGLISNFGISVYYPYEVKEFIKHFEEPITVEFPLNVFDQRFVTYLAQWKKAGFTLFARSIFLQGLFFLSDEVILKNFSTISESIFELRRVAKKARLDLYCLLLYFVAGFKELDGFIVGVDSLEQFRQNLKCLENFYDVRELLKNYQVDDEDIIIPSRWKL